MTSRKVITALMGNIPRKDLDKSTPLFALNRFHKDCFIGKRSKIVFILVLGVFSICLSLQVCLCL